MREKRLLRRVIAAGAVLLVLVILYGSCRIRAQRTREAAAEVPELLLSLTADEIAEIAFRGVDGAEVVLTRQGGEWRFADGSAADQTACSLFAARFTGVAVRQVIADPTNLAEYGLSEPYTEAAVTDSSGRRTVLSVGDENAMTGNTYVQRDGDAAKIYVTDASFRTLFAKSAEDFRP